MHLLCVKMRYNTLFKTPIFLSEFGTELGGFAMLRDTRPKLGPEYVNMVYFCQKACRIGRRRDMLIVKSLDIACNSGVFIFRNLFSDMDFN